MKYTIELTEEQMRVLQLACEEYFRLRMGQDADFCDFMASMNRDLSKDNPNHRREFDSYIQRRTHLHELMRAFYWIACEPTGYIGPKTDDMLTIEDIWDAIKFARGNSRWGTQMQVGSEPIPKITIKKD